MHAHGKTLKYAMIAAFMVLPLLLQPFGANWVRIADTALVYVMMALGLNIVVGYAGLLDLGYVAFYAVGAYMVALLTSSHLTDNFTWIATVFSAGMDAPWWVTLPLGAVLAAFFGALLGAPTLKLRGDYLAIVTLSFGEIVRILINNLGDPINVTNGAKGLGPIASINFLGVDLGKPLLLGNYEIASVTLYYYLFLLLTLLAVAFCYRVQDSRIGRAWMAIRDDAIAAEAMGINTRNMKLLAFAIGASLGGVSGVLFGTLQGFVSPEAFSLQESVLVIAMVVLGGIGHIPGVILGAVLLTVLPEVLRYIVGPLPAMV